MIQRYNEYIMTGLRCIWGVNLDYIYSEFGETYYLYLVNKSTEYINNQLIVQNKNILTLTSKGKFLADGIASDLFYE